MSRRHLHGESVLATWEVRGENLSDALSEAALVVRDLENDDYVTAFFSVVTSWDTESEVYDLTIFARY